MTIYFPYGVVAIGMSMYIFYTIRKRRKALATNRRSELRDTRQSWLDQQLGKITSPIILYGEFMEKKIQALDQVGESVDQWETYYMDKENGEKWIKEYPYPEMQAGGPPQLRKVQLFPYED